MPTPVDISTWRLQRSLWPQKKVFEALLNGSPIIGVVQKDKSFHEEYRYINEGTFAGQGISANFEKAKNAKSPDGAAQFQYATKTLYSLFSLPGKLMRRAEQDAAVLVKPYTRASKNAIRGLKRELSAYIYGNGGGAVGRISSTSNVATNTITLSDTSRHRFFYKNMILNTAATDGTSGTVNAGTVKVVDVIRDGASKGNIILDQALTTGIPGALANDYLFRDGCFGSVLNGFGAHIPSSAPSGSFLGVDRTTLTAETAGLRVTATDMLVKDAVYQAAMDVVDMFGEPDLCILNTANWNVLRKELDNQTAITVQAKGYDGKVVTGLEYGALEIMGPAKKIRVLCDPDCPLGRGYMLTQEVWTLASMGELVRLIGDPMMEENADSWESRFLSESELQCEAHGVNATFQLTAGA